MACDPWHRWPEFLAPVAPYQPFPRPLQPTAVPTVLSDADIDRIARRVVELLRETKP